MTRTSLRRSIGAKTVLALSFTFLSLTALIYLILDTIMLGSIAQQEEKYVSGNIKKAVNAVESAQNELGQIAVDWAVWTDTYTFMKDSNAAYLANTLIPESLKNIRLDAMALVHSDGSFAFSGMPDSKKNQFNPFPAGLSQFCSQLSKSSAVTEATRGLLVLPEGPLLYATSPILAGDGKGPSRGVLFVGRLMDSEETALLAANLKQDFTICALDKADPEVLNLFKGNYTTPRIRELSRDIIAGYEVMCDAYGNPAVVISLTTDREMSRIGWQGIRYTVVSLVAACVLSLILLMTALNQVVIKRLKALCNDIKIIAVNKAFTGRLRLGNEDDELTIVADEINSMLDSLASSRAQILERDESLLKANEELHAEIAERERIQCEIKHLAYHDSLTGLPNRIFLAEQLNHGIELSKRVETMLAVLFLDLDGFKMINDTMGHASGDLLLVEVAKRLTRTMRKSDIIARLGGDEFIVMIENLTSTEDVAQIADKVLMCFTEPYSVNGQECFITASAGIAVYPMDGDDAEALLKNADIAMYNAKEKGKNQYVLCTNGIKAKVRETMKMSNKLFRALERNEFELYYQPQIGCNSNEIVGVEALIRWHHPDLGMVLPGEFIGIAEQTGLIIPIGEWVIRTACMQNKAWQEDGLPAIRMSVNLSIKQFQNHNIVKEVQGILNDTGMKPEYLEIEITESIAMRDHSDIIESLKALKTMGVRIAIDDFGTEYSSMNHLKQLPVDKIKIPMPFVQGIDVSDKDKAITKSIIVLAKSLGLSVLAEGVETKQQNDFLTCRMCDEIQGFYYYKPMPAEEVELLLHKQVADN